MKPISMKAVEPGAVYFQEEQMGDEVRETYYLRTQEGMALYGCIQGDPNAKPERMGDPPPAPRYRNLAREPFPYPLVPMLPVKPLAQSRWAKQFSVAGVK